MQAGRDDIVYSSFKSHFKMRSPSPSRRGRSLNPKNTYNRRRSPTGYKRPRSRSFTPPGKRRPSNHGNRRRSRSRSRSPRPRRKFSPHRRARLPRRRSSSSSSSSSSRSPKRRSKSPKLKPQNARQGRRRDSPPKSGNFKPKPLHMDRTEEPKDDSRRRFSSAPDASNRNRDDKYPGANREAFQGSFDESRSRLPNRNRDRDQPNKPKQKSPESDFSPYRDNSGGRGDVDYRNLPPPTQASTSRNRSPTHKRSPLDRRSPHATSRSSSPPAATRPSRERFDQTGITISDRFLGVTGLPPPFSPTENITIGIERNIPGNMPSTIPRDLFPAEVVIVRRKDEGVKTLCQRLEFLGPKEEVVEHRTIKVAPTDEPKQKQRVSLEKMRPMLTERWRLGDKVESRDDLDDFILSPDSSSTLSIKHGDRDDRFKGSDSRSQGRRQPIDRDERIVLEKGIKVEKGPVDSFKFTVNLNPNSDEPFNKHKTRFERDPNDLRHNLSKKKPRASSTEKDDSFDARQKLLKKREHELKKRESQLKKRAAELEKKEKTFPPGGKKSDKDSDLPDFSNRPDKFENKDWNERPDVTPKGIYYYEVKPKLHSTKQTAGFNPRADNQGPKGYLQSRVDSSPEPQNHRPRGRSPDNKGPQSYKQRGQSPTNSYRARGNRSNPQHRQHSPPQHDNRDWRGGGRGYRGRGYRGTYEPRGRGGYRGSTYRGRGAYRGSVNSGDRDRSPRGSYSNRGSYHQRGRGRKEPSPVGRPWKHDKFQDDNGSHSNRGPEDKEEKPSSTT